MANVQQAPNMMAMIAPDLQAQQIALQRQQQFADLLRQQSSTPIETNQMVTGAGPARVVPISPWQGLAKMLTAGIGGYMQRDTDAKQLELGKQMSGRMVDMLRQTLPPDTAGAPPTPAQPDPSSAAMVAALQGPPRTMSDGSSVPNRGPTPEAAAILDGMNTGAGSAPAAPTQAPPQMPNINHAALAAMLAGNPELANKLTEQAWSKYGPTDATKLAIAAGVDPVAANQGALKKANYMAPENIRPGGYSKDPNTNTVTNYPLMPEGYQAVPDGNGGFKTMPVAGLLEAMSNSEAAKRAGVNRETLAPPNQSVTNPDGTTQPISINSLLHPGAAGAGAPSSTLGFPPGTALPAPTQPQVGALQPGQDDRLTILQQELAKTTNPVDQAALQRDIARLAAPSGATPGPTAPQGVGAPFGRQKGAEDAQTELSKKFTDLTAGVQQAQTTNSYLQSIRALADKAGAGAFSDRTQLANNLLSYAGISEKATNEATAKNLMDKYSNQITARLGGGANGSDARSAIISAAYPNSHMTPAAIKEAVDNLVGANDMIKAKSVVLSPHANARDPVAYQQKEQVFDQNADPRIWQWKSIRDPAQKKAFAALIMQQDPSFPSKIQALDAIGAFK